MFTKKQRMDKFETFISVLLDLHLSVKSNFFIGTAKSNLSNMIIKLLYLSKNNTKRTIEEYYYGPYHARV